MVTIILRQLAAIAILGCLVQQVRAQPVDAPKQAREIAAKVCSSCHGAGGNGGDPMFPKLAAQPSLYLENQLTAFRSHERAEPDAQHYMWGPANRSMDEQLIGAMAKYYSEQPPPKGVSGNGDLIAKGRKLYQEGSAPRGIPACASCHGVTAAGQGLFPRLAGQHRQYLLKQLQLIQKAVRSAPVMHGVIEHLDKEDMEALATYLQSQD